ncbi:hypothetical protein [Tateyamaria sp. SN6-1]|uniref:hypothetical protein n=1 Tax=Tateyamaria sp. SN6-1 TaxID=3092148 RepID=UPI0039F50EF4
MDWRAVITEDAATAAAPMVPARNIWRRDIFSAGTVVFGVDVMGLSPLCGALEALLGWTVKIHRTETEGEQRQVAQPLTRAQTCQNIILSGVAGQRAALRDQEPAHRCFLSFGCSEKVFRPSVEKR